eukprot:03849.XXX_82418_82805_1 [CDS] Oithona nana genome sequencing.
MLSWVFGKPVFAGLLLVPFVEFRHRMTKLGIELASGWLEWMNIFVGVCQDWAMTDMTLGPRQEVDLLYIDDLIVLTRDAATSRWTCEMFIIQAAEALQN